MSTGQHRTIPLKEFLALRNANNPSETNPYATIDDLGLSLNITVVPNYSALPDPTTVAGKFYFAENSEGIWWLPGSVGGNFHNAGLYYSNGVIWKDGELPFQATLAEVNAGTVTDKFVTPSTFENANKWNTKANASHTHTAAEVTDFDTEVSNNIDVSANTTARHTHSNKPVLDQITQEDFNLLAATSSTGLLFGGHVSINVDNTKFNVDAGYGVIVDNTVYPPVKTFVTWTPKIAQSTPFLATDTNTFIAIDLAGNLVLTNELQDYFQTSDVIILGWVEHTDNTTIARSLTEPYYTPDLQQQFNQFLEALGGFNINGNLVQPNGNNLKLDITAGIIFDNGIGYDIDKQAVNIFPTSTINAVQFRYFERTAIDWNNANVLGDTVITNLYDDGSGTLQTVPANQWIVQRVYYYGPFGYLDIYHSQEYYPTKEDAINSLLVDTFEENPYLSFDIPIAAIVVREDCTDLTDLTKAEVRKITKSALGGISNTIGEANTAGNVNTSGIGIYKQKTGVALEFRGIDSGNAIINVSLNAISNAIEIGINNASLNSFITSNADVLAKEVSANKGVANGYAGLDSGSKVPATNSRASNVTYNATNGTLTFTWADGSSQNIDLPIENLLQSASYNSSTQTLTVTTNGGGTIDISLATLVDLPEVVLSASSNPSVAPSTGQKLYIRQDNGAYWSNVGGAWTGGYLGVTSVEKGTWNGKEDSSNKSTSTGDSASTTKFPVWSAIVSYFSAIQIRSILGITTLSGSNTGDETTVSIQTKRPLKTIDGQLIEGTGNITTSGGSGGGITVNQVLRANTILNN